MLFRQFFEPESSTYTYLLASGIGREALIIDPVKEQAEQYLQAIRELDLRLLRAIDTHTHADHITALGDLRDATGCVTIMGDRSRAECVSQTVRDGDILELEGLRLQARYTPGHTDESFSFVLRPERPHRFPERQPRGFLAFHCRGPVPPARRDAGLPRARLQGLDELVHRRGEAPQPAPGRQDARAVPAVHA